MDENITLCGLNSSFFLQKWSKKFNCFVGVDDVVDLVDGDRVTVVHKKKKNIKEESDKKGCKEEEVSGHG